MSSEVRVVLLAISFIFGMAGAFIMHVEGSHQSSPGVGFVIGFIFIATGGVCFVKGAFE